jgi:tRNA A-37 threonylcarbamoyl transferase component Bud32
MSRTEIHPAYRAFFAELGLRTAADFLRLEGEILGGHPNRHVLRQALGGETASAACSIVTPAREAVTVGAGGTVGRVVPRTGFSVPDSDPGVSPPLRDRALPPPEDSALSAQPLGVYLKKEHRVSWRDRLAHAWLGFGWVSKSLREGRMLRQVERAGIGCPRALAWGEADGRAFLLVREEPDAADLRDYLRSYPNERPKIAAALAQAVARIHEAGFFHRDLSSKHILIEQHEDGHRFCFLDWQRARRQTRVSWRQRLLDLAMLDATLAADCASPRERLLFWNAYLAAVDSFSARWRQRALNGTAERRNQSAPAKHSARSKLLHALCRLSTRLQRKRRIRELRQAPLPAGQQNLIWLDGEALCVTRQFLDDTGTPPTWLRSSGSSPARNAVEVTTVAGTSGRSWRLVRRWSHRPFHWLLRWWRRAPFPAPEFEHAAAIIRLERHGVEAPRLLALGHHSARPWRQESFLLVEPPADTAPLLAVLETAELRKRRRLLREAGALWRRIHEAGYAWRGDILTPLAVHLPSERLVLTGVEWLQRRGAAPERLARRDFRRLLDAPLPNLSASDKLCFALGYFGQEQVRGGVGRLLRRLMRAWRGAQRRRAWRAWRERRVH